MAKDKKQEEIEEPKDNRPDENNEGDLPKFNMNWIYVMIAIGLLLYTLWNFKSVEQEPISMSEFETIATNKGVIRNIIIWNKDYAEVFLRDSITEKYHPKDAFVLDYIRSQQMDEGR
jgi:hypothetical protein